ncbi:MAG: MMPL family transporter, partial [Thiolinea sp.]
TTAAGFGSLALADIPPIQVFGVFVAIGVMLAWVLTVTLVPAYIMSLKPATLDSFGRTPDRNSGALPRLGQFSYRSAKPVLLATLALYGVAVYGLTRIHINDNPVHWFKPDHDIRVADRVLNQAFAGTYMAYIALDAGQATEQAVPAGLLEELKPEVRAVLLPAQTLPAMSALAEERKNSAETDAEFAAWEDALVVLDRAKQQAEVFKSPEVLRWMEGLQQYLLTTGHVGKSNSLNEIVKTVHRELQQGAATQYRIPATPEAVAQTLLTFQSSHRPNDLWHFVTPDYRSSVIWLQLNSGENRDMSAVVDAVDQYVAAHPAPGGLATRLVRPDLYQCGLAAENGVRNAAVFRFQLHRGVDHAHPAVPLAAVGHVVDGAADHDDWSDVWADRFAGD